MYPKPDSTKLAEPQKIIAVDIKRGKLAGITIEATPELRTQTQALIEIERHRIDLIARLRAYKAALLARIEPHCGERPKHIPLAKWRDIEQRTKLIADLPNDAPGEARDALLALRTLSILNDAMIVLRDITPAIRQAVCSAIDLGMLLQRGQTQIDHGEAVDRGRINMGALEKATRAGSAGKTSKSDVAFDEYFQSMQPEIVSRGIASESELASMSRSEFMMCAKRTAKTEEVLQRMAMVTAKDANGSPVKNNRGKLKLKFGSLRNLKRYVSEWRK